MTRRLFTLQYLLLLAMCAGACAMWVRSQHTAEWLERRRSGLTEPGFQSVRGGLLIHRQLQRWANLDPPQWTHDTSAPWNINFDSRTRGFEFGGIEYWLTPEGGVRSRLVGLPWWLVVLVFLILAMMTFPLANSGVSECRRRRGQCPACGYDLRSSPVQCPECGRENDLAKGRRGRYRFWMAGASTCLLLMLLVFFSILSDPARGASGGPGANPDEGITFYPPWENARGDAPDRMFHQDVIWGQRWHQAMWRHRGRPGEDQLVIIAECSVGMFREYCGVTVLDRSMHVVRRGMVGLPPGDWKPYRLVEIRTDDASLPAEYRSHWDLAVESLPSDQYRKGYPDDHQPEADRMTIIWDQTADMTSYEWQHADDLAVRSAEP